MNTDLSTLPVGVLVALGVLVVVQLSLDVIALVDLYRRPAARVVSGNKWIWLAVILLVSLLGAILYLLVGRMRTEAAVAAPGPDREHRRCALRPARRHRPPMTAAIQATALTKTYGDSRALDAMDLTVPEGSVFGFLGANGAGKTTTLRLLTGLARPTSGSVEVLGHDVATAGNAVRAEIGFLPDVPGFYDWMTAPELLRFAGGLFGIGRPVLEGRVEMLLDLAGLTDVTTTIGGYSRGMKQRLGVAQSLVNAPRLLLLDEPTSALDPMGRKDVLEMIASLRGRP